MKIPIHDLDELAQEVRIRLWRALLQSENIERVQTSYGYRAARSAALDIIRRRGTRPEEPLDVEHTARLRHTR